MGTSIHRVIAIAIFMNLIFGFILFISGSDVVSANNEISRQNEISDLVREGFEDDNPDAESNYIDKQFGDIKLFTKQSMWSRLKNGITKFSTNWASNSLEFLLLLLLGLFTIVIDGYMIWEVLAFIFTKKNS